MITSATLYVEPDDAALADLATQLREIVDSHEGSTQLKLAVLVSESEALFLETPDYVSCKLNTDIVKQIRKHPAVRRVEMTAPEVREPERPKWMKHAGA